MYGILGAINLTFNIKTAVNCAYTIFFGVVVIMIHLIRSDFISRQFGFLMSSLGRGLFYIL
ncbi:hypothetical protein DSO57_1015916 [Entomophthora muscae]|uniref:Uncharacterized protein n=1 Tax=Entomophthora muscae TaxID=34485 RepID=A0ACC2TRY2_9FUNG|nr:hypothetical protein DSO57_1015916 [Entomophthora muscae]